MAFVRKEDTGSGEQVKFENFGDSLTGIYLGSFEHEGKFGTTSKHLFKTDKGIKVVFGQRHLTELIAGTPIGSLVRVTYEKNKKVNKGNPMKMYTLDVDDGGIADAETVIEALESLEDAGDVEDEEVPADEVKTAPAKTKPTATAPTAAQRASAQSILSRHRAVAKTVS